VLAGKAGFSVALAMVERSAQLAACEIYVFSSAKPRLGVTALEMWRANFVRSSEK
jgi:hypothetical protein